MTRISSRPGQSNVAVIWMLGVIIILVVAGLIIIPLALRQDDSRSQSSSMSSAASTAGTSVASVAQQQASSARTPGQQAAIDDCINLATLAHNQLWAQTCAQENTRFQRAYNACIANGQAQSYCQVQFGAYSSMGSSCTLSLVKQNALNLEYNAAKIVCQNRTY